MYDEDGREDAVVEAMIQCCPKVSIDHQWKSRQPCFPAIDHSCWTSLAQELEMVLRAADENQFYGVLLSMQDLIEADPVIARALIENPKVDKNLILSPESSSTLPVSTRKIYLNMQETSLLDLYCYKIGWCLLQ